MKLQADLREFVELLNAHGVEYLIIGGHAVAFHGYVRFTGDIDVLVRPSQDNATKLVAMLHDFGFGQVGLTTDDFTTLGGVVQLGRPPNRIDILTSGADLDFDKAWATCVPSTIDGIPTNYLGRAALLANKKAAGRAKDLADIEALEAVWGAEDSV